MKATKKSLTKLYDKLPTIPEELHKFILIGKEVLKSQQAKIRAIEKAEMAKAAKEAALSDTQDIAEILLDAEVKLGEILASRPTRSSRKRTPDKSKLNGQEPLPNGIDKKQSHYAQKLAKHPKIVEEAKAEARQEGTIVTSSKVIEKITRKIKPISKSTEEILKSEYETAYELYDRAIQNAMQLNWRGIEKVRVVSDLNNLIFRLEVKNV